MVPFTIALGEQLLVLRVSCFGARGGAEPVDEGVWRMNAEEGVAIFLLGDDAEDGAFLERLAHDEAWEATFYDDRWHQLALTDRAGAFELMLKLEQPGAPIPAAGASPEDGDAIEEALGPALWVTVQPARIV